jgi:predicted polyphosphate/ATP-dependent NAD kinase
VHGDATFSEGSEANVALAVDFGGDGCHADIVKCREDS